MWARRSWMARGFKIFLLLLLIHTFVYQQFPFLPVLAFTYRIPVPYLSIYPIYLSSPFALETIGNILVFFSVRCLPDQPSFSLSRIHPFNYLVNTTSYHTHTALQSRTSIIQVYHFLSLFFAHAPPDSGFNSSVYMHTLHYASCCGFAVDTFPPFFLVSFYFLLIRSAFFSI